MNFSHSTLNSESIKRKLKFPVTIIDEKCVDEVLNIDQVRNIMSKDHHVFGKHAVFNFKFQYDKIVLNKNRKWFNKFKELNVQNIQNYFYCTNDRQLVMLYIGKEQFYGFVILRIEQLSNMKDLENKLKHEHRLIPMIVDSKIPNENEYTSIAVLTKYSTTNGNDDENYYNNYGQLDNQPNSSHANMNGNGNHQFDNPVIEEEEINEYSSSNYERSIVTIEKSEENNMTRIDPHSNKVISDDGPVGLYSKSYPSAQNDMNFSYNYKAEIMASTVESDDSSDYNDWYK